MTRKILRLSEISERTGVPAGTLRNYKHRGIGPTLWTLGGRVVGYEDEIEAWIEEQYATTASTKPAA